MNVSYPVYTVVTECQDCYKCVRHCPVKAIRVRDGHAAVIPEMCVACGKCVEVCPVKAKRVRNDAAAFRELAAGRSPVYISLAPSWVSEFRDLPAGKLIRALKMLGASGVSETALGAQIVSSDVAHELDKISGGLLLSSACPTAVDYIRKYLPELAGKITAVGSPVMAHCRMLQRVYPGCKVVFVGPCIGKKNESDRRPELLALALTYPELRGMFREAGIEPEKLSAAPDDRFVPESAEEGAKYPVEGGMNDTIEFQTRNRRVHYAAIAGIHNIELALSGVRDLPENETAFVELLACPGGCVHGPCAEHDSPGLLERLRVVNRTKFPENPRDRASGGDDLTAEYPPDASAIGGEPSLADLESALRSVGKTTPEDELNCDGCGYNTCRNFAKAMLAGKAEPSMCVSYMRKLAQKKANALLRTIPSGVVIVDGSLAVIECNRNFAQLFGADTVEAFDASPGLVGADLARIVPFHELFRSALLSGGDVERDSLKVGDKLYNVKIFNLEPHTVAGAVIFDVTKLEMRRERIADRAREVIDRNISAVQEIACRLGEQMADTELLLRSIADDYADDPAHRDGDRETGA